jgi:hypothetical protein
MRDTEECAKTRVGIVDVDRGLDDENQHRSSGIGSFFWGANDRRFVPRLAPFGSNNAKSRDKFSVRT